ncbi:MAG TPA: glycosyltransferase family 4 protein [Bacillota bacterium]|nr:glycosyltransferase family 4 protein [Bacillota bacterium]
MKILIVSPKFHPVIGGGETYVLNSIKRLHDAGQDVSIAVEPHPQRNLKGYPYPVYELEGLSDARMDIIAATAKLYKLIEQVKPDIIHVHGYFGLLVTGFGNPTNIPIVLSVHSTPVWGERIVGGMDSFEAELNFARGTLAVGRPRLVTAANSVYAEAAEKIVDGKFEVAVLPYPVDADYFYKKDGSALRQQWGLTSDDVLLTIPSRIIERKGIKEAIFALTELPEHFHLCVSGAVTPLDPVYWQSIQESPEYKAVQDRVIVPKQPFLYDDMPALYGATDIVVMPSYYEGAPVATVEAMASGKPFVGADSQGINSFIRNEENGLLVPQKTVKELAQAIQRVANDPALGVKMAGQARKDIPYLSWDAQLPVLIDTYKRVLAA